MAAEGVNRPGTGLSGHIRGEALVRPRLSTVATSRRAKPSTWNSACTALRPNTPASSASRSRGPAACEAAGAIG